MKFTVVRSVFDKIQSLTASTKIVKYFELISSVNREIDLKLSTGVCVQYPKYNGHVSPSPVRIHLSEYPYLAPSYLLRPFNVLTHVYANHLNPTP